MNKIISLLILFIFSKGCDNTKATSSIKTGPELKVYIGKEKVKLNSYQTITIEILKKRYDSSYVLLGDYDKEFYLRDSTTLVRVPMEGNVVDFNVNPYMLGADTVRGYVVQWKDFDSSKYDSVRLSKFEVIYEVIAPSGARIAL
jgi:hypothetical protein